MPTDYQHQSRAHLNQGHDAVDQRFKHYQQFDRRQRRQAIENENDRALDEALQCRATRCAIIRCMAGPIGDKDVAFIGLRSRIVAQTLHKISSGSSINFSTMTVARVTRLPYIGRPKEMPLKTHEIQVVAKPEPIPVPDVVPLWIVVLAACAGTIILLLLIYLLSKVSWRRLSLCGNLHAMLLELSPLFLSSAVAENEIFHYQTSNAEERKTTFKIIIKIVQFWYLQIQNKD